MKAAIIAVAFMAALTTHVRAQEASGRVLVCKSLGEWR